MSSFLTIKWQLAGLSSVIAGAAILGACGTAGQAGAPAPRTVTVTATPSASGHSGDPAPPASTPAGPPTQPAAPTRTPGGPPTCLASVLRASLGPSEGAAGTIYQTVVLTNASSATCSLYGYPGVSFVTSIGGSQIGAPASRNPLRSPLLVTLRPGQSADTRVGVAQAADYPRRTCQPLAASWLKIYPPGDYGAVYLKYKAQACGRSSLSILTATAVQ
jgi:hypothetical protein